MNHKVLIERAGGPEQIIWVDAPKPELTEGKVLVRVEAAGVAFGDVLLRRGLAGTRFPVTPGYDFVGVVEATGPGSKRFAIGDRVAGFPGQGGQQERVCLPESELVRVPAGISAQRAAGVILNYLTALQILKRGASLQRGQSVFMYGLSGGLGSAMRQVAPQMGIRVYGTASGSRLAEASRGATAFDRTRPTWIEEARRAEPAGFDLVLDPIGGPSLSRSFGILSGHGTLLMLGAANSVQGKGSPRIKLIATLTRFLWLKLRSGPRRVQLFMVEGPSKRPQQFGEDMALLFGWLVDGSIDPAINKTLLLSEAREAHEMLESGNVQGKIVLLASPS